MKTHADWKWFGHAGHFILGSKCQFHLCTHVGKYLVSTVGELWNERKVREIHAEIHDPAWFIANRRLLGDTFDAAYMKRFGYEEIGCDRKYETMVFLAGEKCAVKECGCEMPALSGSELECRGYNDAGSAAKGHYELCNKCEQTGYEIEGER